MSTPAIVLRHVTKAFGHTVAVDDVSLEVPTGSIYGFIGPNGSGKTTTLRMIMHILLPDHGAIEVLGLSDTRAARDHVGYLPEERGLYKKMTVRRLLAYYGALKGANARMLAREIDAWFDRLDLTRWANHKIEALSKGTAQRVQFVAAVVARPQLAVLDEPFSGLDPVNQNELRDALLELRERGTTVVLSTHDMDTAERLCDRIFMIFRGRKVLDGRLADIQAEYGADTIRVRVADKRVLATMRYVEAVDDLGNIQQVRVSGDPQAFLAELVTRTGVQLFEIANPSLHDIFLRIARPEAHV